MKFWWKLAVVIAILSWSVSSFAYVLPAKQILAFMKDHVGRKGTLVVLQKTVLYDPELDGGMQELEETLYYKPPGMFRSEASRPGIDRVRVVGPGGAVTLIEGKVMSGSVGPFDHYKDLFLFRNPEVIEDALSQLGVDLGTVSLGRFKDKIAFVIGARFPDTSKPQVWIEKESFRPIRFVTGEGNGEPLREIEYLEYRLIEKGKSYPGRILFYEGGDLVKMQVVESFDINADISDELFDVAYLKKIYEPVLPPPPPASELDEVKKSIQDFRRVFE